MKRIFIMLFALLFVFSVVSMAFADSAKIEGTVTKIEGKKVTVKDEKGKETTVTVKDLGGAKVGDKVEIKDGKVTVKKEPVKKPSPAPGY